MRIIIIILLIVLAFSGYKAFTMQPNAKQAAKVEATAHANTPNDDIIIIIEEEEEVME